MKHFVIFVIVTTDYHIVFFLELFTKDSIRPFERELAITKLIY